MFFKKEINKDQDNKLIKIASLLIHAAKIDQNYSDKEKYIVESTLLELGAKKEKLKTLISEAIEKEKNSVQILDFTKEVKNMNENEKVKIIETLWRIIYSNKDADIYETNLMRRLAGLLYVDSKIMGDIKDRIEKENL